MKTITLTQGKSALVDDEDFERVNQFNWVFEGRYASRKYMVNYKSTKIYLHRFILNAPKGICIDHKDGNRLNCQKSNLRFANKSQNAMNRSVSGITWVKTLNKWRAQIKLNYKNIFLGQFLLKEDAIIARKEAEKNYFKEFAYD